MLHSTKQNEMMCRLPECIFGTQEEQACGSDEIHSLTVANRRIMQAISSQQLLQLIHLRGIISDIAEKSSVQKTFSV